MQLQLRPAVLRELLVKGASWINPAASMTICLSLRLTRLLRVIPGSEKDSGSTTRPYR